MAKNALPGNRRWTQLNEGDNLGLIRGTYNVDFDTNRGKVRPSIPVLEVYSQDDKVSFNDPAAAIAKFENNYYIVAGDVHNTSLGDPTVNSDWAIDTTTGNPSPAPTVTDAVVWNDLFLVIENNTSPAFGDIAKLVSGTWDRNWWRTTLSASTDRLIKLVAAPDGNLYPVSSTGKVYKLTPALAVSVTGDGTLDLSERPITFTTAVTNTTRMWIGFEDEDKGTGGVVEWDMSATSISPNRTHQLGAPVRCLAEWNDIIIAVLQNGRIKYNAGGGFVEWEGVSIPETKFPLDEDFIHKNGWAIIDGLPHFLINFELNAETGNAITERSRNSINSPSGIYCLDPEVGFYHRFALGTGESTQDDYGQHSIYGVGALYSLRDTEVTRSKFLASYSFIDETNTEHAVLAYDDPANTNDVKAYIQYTKQSKVSVARNIELLHKKLSTGSTINIYSRLHEDDSIYLGGYWADTTQFNTTDDASAVENNDLALVRYGKGAGQFLRVDTVTQGTTVDVLTFQSAADYVSTNNQSILEITNYKYTGTVNDTVRDHHTFSFPFAERSREIDVLIEITQAAGNTEELDLSILET